MVVVMVMVMVMGGSVVECYLLEDLLAFDHFARLEIRFGQEQHHVDILVVVELLQTLLVLHTTIIGGHRTDCGR